MRRLLPFLNECSADIVIGGTPDDPKVVLTVGPMEPAAEEAFRERVRPMLKG